MNFIPVLMLFATLQARYDSTVISLANDIMGFTFSEKYDEAWLLIDRLEQHLPDDPLPHILRAGLDDYWMLDYTSNSLEDEFNAEVDTAAKLAEKFKKSDRALYHFYRGIAYAYRATREGRNRSVFNAVRFGRKALKELRRALKYDSTLYDAYLPIGIFDYALSELPGFIKFFVGNKDKREQGLKEVELAAEKGWLTRTVAKDALAWMLAYHGDYGRALKIARELVQEYPESRTFRWTLVYVLRRTGRWKEALDVYNELFYLIASDPKQSDYNIAVILYWITKGNYYQRHWGEAVYYGISAEFMLEKCDPNLPGVKYMRKRVKVYIDLARKRVQMEKESDEKLPVSLRGLKDDDKE